MRRYAAALLAAIIFTLTLAGCSSKYDAEDFIGKTSAEIVDENGAFDCVIGETGEDGLYRDSKCGYTIKAKKAGFWARRTRFYFSYALMKMGLRRDVKKELDLGDRVMVI